MIGLKRFAAGLTLLLPLPLLAADAISGAVQKQSTNYQAIVMFTVFVAGTLGITVGFKTHPLAQRLLYRGRQYHRLSKRAGDGRRLYVRRLVSRHLRAGLHLRLRRPDLFAGLSGRLADHSVSDRRAAAQRAATPSLMSPLTAYSRSRSARFPPAARWWWSPFI